MMACACGGSSARSAAGQQQQAAAAGGGAYVWRATFNDGTSRDFSSESEVQSALAFKGGGYKMVTRGS